MSESNHSDLPAVEAKKPQQEQIKKEEQQRKQLLELNSAKNIIKQEKENIQKEKEKELIKK